VTSQQPTLHGFIKYPFTAPSAASVLEIRKLWMGGTFGAEVDVVAEDDAGTAEWRKVIKATREELES
jgi:hypothetical protein